MKEEIRNQRAFAFYERFETELGHEWELMTEYRGSHEPLSARHIPCGEIRTVPAKDFFRRGCRSCERARAYRSRFEKSGAKYIRRIEAEYNVTSVSEYRGRRMPHKWRCNVCGTEIEKTVENILFRGNGYGGGLQCDICANTHTRLIAVLKKRLAKLQAVERANDRKSARREYINSLCKNYEQNGYDIIGISNDLYHVTLLHRKCGRAYTTTVNVMKHGHGCRACSRCGTSYGVQQIEQYLHDNHIQYEREVTFPTCKRERMLPFDFAIYDDKGNITHLIEYQGEQHYRATAYFGGREKLARVQEADAIKRQWARDNHVNLIVVDWDVNIFNSLATLLN